MPRKNPPAAKGASPKEAGIDPGLWRDLKKALRPVLVLDFDGTLAPLHRERMKVRIPQASREALEKIILAERTRVIVITGRPATQAALLMPGLKVEIIGEHGWERMTPSGKIKRHPLSQEHKAALDLARDLAKKRGLAHRIERKRTTVALHTRGMPPGQANLLECVLLSEWGRLCEGGKLECMRFNGGIELRSPEHTKGTAMRSILAAQRKPDFVLYAGDDRTDEDALEALKGLGHRMAVGLRVPDKLIDHRFTGPDQLGEFLVKWAKVEAAPKEAPPKKAPPEKPVRKAAAKTPSPKPAAPAKVPPKKAVAARVPPKKGPAAKGPVKKGPAPKKGPAAKKGPAKKRPAKKGPAKKEGRS